MKNIFIKYPYLYLLLFCFGGLIVGFNIAKMLENGFNMNNSSGFYFDLITLIFNFSLTLYFFYRFVKSQKEKN